MAIFTNTNETLLLFCPSRIRAPHTINNKATTTKNISCCARQNDNACRCNLVEVLAKCPTRVTKNTLIKSLALWLTTNANSSLILQANFQENINFTLVPNISSILKTCHAMCTAFLWPWNSNASMKTHFSPPNFYAKFKFHFFLASTRK